MAFTQLTPILMRMREFPKDRTTWREGSVFNTEWAQNFHHYTSETNWCVVGPKEYCLPVSQGSVIFDTTLRELSVVVAIEQRTTREDIAAQTFHALKKWKLEEARGQQWLFTQSLTVQDGVITAVDPTIHEYKYEQSERWTYAGQIEDFNQVDGLVYQPSAAKFAHNCSKEDPMFVVGINMDACRPYRFSGKLDGTCFVYGRDMAGRGSYTHFVWPLAAVDQRMDKSMATALIGRDIAYAEQHDMHMHRVSDTGEIKWQKVFAHLGNFVSDREGSDRPLGRLKSGAKTKNEWKCFAGWREGYTVGERRKDEYPHPFHGSTRLFRGVCCPRRKENL